MQTSSSPLSQPEPSFLHKPPAHREGAGSGSRAAQPPSGVVQGLEARMEALRCHGKFQKDGLKFRNVCHLIMNLFFKSRSLVKPVQSKCNITFSISNSNSARRRTTFVLFSCLWKNRPKTNRVSSVGESRGVHLNFFSLSFTLVSRFS